MGADVGGAVGATAADGDTLVENDHWGADAPLVQALSIKAAAMRTTALRGLGPRGRTEDLTELWPWTGRPRLRDCVTLARPIVPFVGMSPRRRPLGIARRGPVEHRRVGHRWVRFSAS